MARDEHQIVGGYSVECTVVLVGRNGETGIHWYRMEYLVYSQAVGHILEAERNGQG